MRPRLMNPPVHNCRKRAGSNQSMTPEAGSTGESPFFLWPLQTSTGLIRSLIYSCSAHTSMLALNLACDLQVLQILHGQAH